MEDEQTRGCCGCFGWLLRLFRRKRRGRREERKDPERSLTPLDLEENEEKNIIVMTVGESWEEELNDVEMAKEEEPQIIKTWAEEVDEAEEKGLDVFAPISCLPHSGHCETEASLGKEAVSGIKMTATQRRRARRKALAAARKASAESEAASLENEAPAAAATETSTPKEGTEAAVATHGGTSARGGAGHAAKR